MKKSWVDDILKLKDPDQLFDLVCFRNYVCGDMDLNIPVSESRKVFERIKKLLKKPE